MGSEGDLEARIAVLEAKVRLIAATLKGVAAVLVGALVGYILDKY